MRLSQVSLSKLFHLDYPQSQARFLSFTTTADPRLLFLDIVVHTQRMMASFMSYFGGRKDPKQAARDAIVGLRQQLQLLEKKEDYMQKKIDEEMKKARANAVSNKAGGWYPKKGRLHQGENQRRKAESRGERKRLLLQVLQSSKPESDK